MDELKNKRIQALVMGGIVGVGLIIIGLVVAIVFSNKGSFVKEKTQVAVFVAPEKAEVKIDNEVYENGVYEIEAGNHVVVISATGYTTRAYEFEVEADKITLLYDYLEKSDGEMDEKDVDALRYLVSEEGITQKISAYMMSLPEDYSFPSEQKSPVRNFETVRKNYGEKLNDYSYKLIKETLDAYFFFARSGTKNVRFIEDSFLDTEFKVSADGRDEYRVMMEMAQPGSESEASREIWRVTILTEAGAKLFQYDGKFTYINLDVDYNEETAEPELDYNL